MSCAVDAQHSVHGLQRCVQRVQPHQYPTQPNPTQSNPTQPNPTQPCPSCTPQMYAILFGVGEQDTEGIYSLRALNDDGLPQETIIVFEGEDDATR